MERATGRIVHREIHKNDRLSPKKAVKKMIRRRQWLKWMYNPMYFDVWEVALDSKTSADHGYSETA
jgi:hypothetical protein